MNKPNRPERDRTEAIIAEKAIIGIFLMDSKLTDSSLLDSISGRLKPGDFIDSQFGELYGVMVDRRALDLPIEPPALLPEAKRIFGTVGTLAELINEVPNTAHADYYADQVIKHSKLRQLEVIASDIAQQTRDATETPESIVAGIEHRLSQIGGDKRNDAATAYDAGIQLIAELDDQAKRRPVFIGIENVDRIVGGIMPGELVVLAARPGNGKTSLAMQMVKRLSSRNRPSLFVSLEMRRTELIARVLCGMAEVDSRIVRSGQASPEQMQRLIAATQELDGQPLTIFDPPTATLPQIRAMARMQKGIGGLDLLCVDYIGLVKPRDRKVTRTEQVSEIVGGLKRLAKELEVPVLALSQLNRQADGTEPRLSHLRESGSVEQDADIVLFLHREGEHSNNFKLIAGKHRHGETGSLTVVFDPRTTTFGTA